MNHPQRSEPSLKQIPVYFDHCAVLFDRDPEFFRRHYTHAILIGLGVVGELNEYGERGEAQTFLADLHDAQDPSSTLRRRIWMIRKREYGPKTVWIRVGRSSDNDIVIPDYSISKHHCEFRRTDTGTLAVYDLQSHNGTHVGGHEIPEMLPFEIQDEDELILGRYAFEYLEAETFITRVKISAAML